MVFPATNINDAVDLIIDDGNTFGTILRGDINTTITVEGGPVPSVAKALSDAIAYKPALLWQEAASETDILQLRELDGFVYAPISVPVTMTAPASPTDWKVFSILRDFSLEPVTLIDGQLVVPFTNPINGGLFHIRGDLVDSGKLFLGADYNYSGNSIVLTQSYPAGTVVQLSYPEAPTPVARDVLESTVSSMKALSLPSGTQVKTKGYLAEGDVGAATYLILTAGQFGGTPDEKGDHTLANGNVAKLRTSMINPIEWWGSKKDGTDDSAALNAACARIFPGGMLDLGTGELLVEATTIEVPNGFNFTGGGTENCVVMFSNMTGLDGFNISQAGRYVGSSMQKFTVAIKGANGASMISTPKGSTVFNTNPPTYYFAHMKCRGDVEDGTLFGLYDFGWATYFDIGDGRNHALTDIEIFGAFNYKVDPLTTNSTHIGFSFSGLQDQGGLSTPSVDRCFTHYVGIPVQFGYRVSNPRIWHSQFHRSYRGVYSPNPSVTSSDYGVLEADLKGLNINSQLSCVDFAKTAFLDISNVRATRAADGFDNSATWTGFKLDQVDDFKINSIRAKNDNITAPLSAHVGMQLTGCDFGNINMANFDDNLSRGIILDDTVRVACHGATFKTPSVSSFQFKGITTDITISADEHTTGTTLRYDFDPGVDEENIRIEGQKHVYNGGVDDSITAVSSTQTIDHKVRTDNQIKYYQGNTGGGAYTVNLDLNDTGATDGDVFMFHLTTVSVNATFVVRDGSAATLLTLPTSASTKHYNVECVYTAAVWRVLGAFESLA